MNGPGDFASDQRAHFEDVIEQAADGTWIIPCGVCRRPWPCAGWHEAQARHHLECARAKSTATPYPQAQERS